MARLQILGLARVSANTNKNPCSWILLIPTSLKTAPHVLNQSVLQVFLVKKVDSLFYDLLSQPCSVPEI